MWVGLSGLDEVVESVDGPVSVDRAGGEVGEGLAGVLVGDVEDLGRPPVCDHGPWVPRFMLLDPG
jgi:hypothetical protein